MLVLQCQIEVEKVLLLFYFGFRHVSLREYVLRVCDDGEQATLAYVVINLQVSELDLHDLHFFRVNLDKLGPLQMHQCDLFPYSKGILADQGHIK